MKYIIGADIGTSGTKAIAFSHQGEILGSAYFSYERLNTPAIYHELNPDELYDAFVSAISTLVLQLQDKATLTAISLSSAMHGLILIGEDHKPLSNLITWADLRSREQAKKLKNSAEAAEIYKLSGTPIHPMSPLCKILWFKENEKELFSKARKFISIKEYIIYKLSGRYLIDYSLASATGLFDIYNLTWNPGALSLAGIRADQLSEPVTTTYVVEGVVIDIAPGETLAKDPDIFAKDVFVNDVVDTDIFAKDVVANDIVDTDIFAKDVVANDIVDTDIFAKDVLVNDVVETDIFGNEIGTFDVKKHEVTENPGAIKEAGSKRVAALRLKTSVVIGAGDGCLANLGTNAVRPGDVSLTIGTSGAVRMVSSKPQPDPRARIFNYILTPGLFVSGGPINNGGVLLKWYSENFLRRPVDDTGDFESFIRTVSTVQPGSDGLVFLPYVQGERAPVWDADAKGVFFGITGIHTQAHFMRAIIEGICFSLLDVSQSLEETLGNINNIYASGGFVKSPAWVQILCDILGKKIYITDTADASSIGAAILGLNATGHMNNLADASAFFSVQNTYQPNPDLSAVYAKNFKIYSGLYEKLKSDF